MKQKIIYGVLFGLTFGITCPAFVYADEPVTTSETTDAEIMSDEDDVTSNSEGSHDCFTDDNGEYICTTLTETEIEEGTSGEAEVICADPNEPGCSEEETLKAEEESEKEAGITETWPMIVSFVAIGATVLIIIICSLLGRRKK